MRYFLLAVFGILLFGIFFWWNRAEVLAPATEVMQEYIVPIAVISGHTLELEVARTPEEQARGLSGKESLAENAGMLFVYEVPVTPGFWMKDMNFPIDIIWIDADKKIIDISENLAPKTFPQAFYPRSPVRYVLEVNAGWAKSHNISIGGEVTLYGVF